MRRIDNIYNRICSIENLMLADEKARKGKKDQYGVRMHDKNRVQNIERLHQLLISKKYKTSPYTCFTIKEPKERLIKGLPYWPDRITHHAIMNVMEHVFTASFTKDTYSCIKGQGIHAVVKKLRKCLMNEDDTLYCLKLDIRKFYPSIDHDILKMLLKRKIKDGNLLWLLYEIIDSSEGVPIGNYLSQYFANFYLSPFDHWLKEQLEVKYYFRYADDIVILSGDKDYLQGLLCDIRTYLYDNLKLSVKSNYQVFPVDKRGIDYVGYVFRHTHVRVRKSIKQNFARMIRKRKNHASIASYMGWFAHCDAKHLPKKLIK